MLRLRFAALAAGCLLLPPLQCVSAQGIFGNQSGLGGQAATAGRTAGLQGTGNGLSERFQSNFGRFTSGAQQVGEVVGASAVSAFNATATGQAGNRNLLSGLGNLGGFSPFGMNSFGRNTFGRNPFTQNQQGATTGKLLRTRMRVDFPHQTISSSVAGQRLEGRLAKTPHIQSVVRVKVTMEGQTAVLQGTVGSAHEQDLAARLAMMEPGISGVRNELTVESAESPPLSPETSGPSPTAP